MRVNISFFGMPTEDSIAVVKRTREIFESGNIAGFTFEKTLIFCYIERSVQQVIAPESIHLIYCNGKRYEIKYWYTMAGSSFELTGDSQDTECFIFKRICVDPSIVLFEEDL